MNEEFCKELQDSLKEHAEIQERLDIRNKKDQKLISMFCAQNEEADVINTVMLLEKYNGLPEHDRQKIKEIKALYPAGKMTVRHIVDFIEIQNIYAPILESGGNVDD